MYHAGDKAGIKQCYASIMRIQMLFAGSMAVVLVGYPQVLLSILAEELLPYTKQFVGCALVFTFDCDTWTLQRGAANDG